MTEPWTSDREAFIVESLRRVIDLARQSVTTEPGEVLVIPVSVQLLEPLVDMASRAVENKTLTVQTYYRIVETDNFGGDYPDEKFLGLPLMRKEDADAIAGRINTRLCNDDRASRFWRVVEDGYELQPGFEP